MSKKHEKLGIKQTIQKHWMDRVVQMMLAGMTEKEIRSDLTVYLSNQKQSGGIGVRGKKTYRMAIAILASWFAPENDLLPIGQDLLNIARHTTPDKWMPIHWAIISMSYPFWFNVAKQVGRLLNLQDRVTQAQVFNRLKEQYGDREAVARNARFSIRSFVAWGALKDSDAKGCYEKSKQEIVTDQKQAILLLEAALHATPERKGALSLLLHNPAFFPFQLPMITGDFVSQHSDRIDVVRYGFDEELLKLKCK